MNAAHLFTRALRELERDGLRLHRLAFGPRALDELALLISDTLHCEMADTADLGEALEEGVIFPSGQAYQAMPGDRDISPAPSNPLFAFLHDRVQQAAYALIPAERKQLVRLTVSRPLLEKSASGAAEETRFDIVNHFNLGSSRCRPAPLRARGMSQRPGER